MKKALGRFFLTPSAVAMSFLSAFCTVPEVPEERVAVPAAAECEAMGSALHRVLDTGELRVGYVVYPPTVFRDPHSGELTGYFVDAITFIAQTMDSEAQFFEAEWSTILAGVQSGDYDVSIAATFRTIPRATRVAFTRPIISIGDGMVVTRGDSRFESLKDFNARGVTIAVVEGTSSQEFAGREFPEATLSVLSTSNMRRPLEEVLAGRADAGISDAPSTAQFTKEHPEVVDLFEDEPFEVTTVGWAVCQGDSRWLAFLNTALDYMESTGRMREWQARTQ